MIELLPILLIAALIGLLALVFVAPVIRFIEAHPEYLIGLVLAVFVYTAALSAETAPYISLGGISVYPLDALCPLLLFFSIPYLWNGLKNGFSKLEYEYLLLLAWGVFLGINYFLGVKDFGIQSATNGFRSYFYMIAIAVYCASLPSLLVWPKIEKMVLYTAFALSIIAVIGLSDGDFSREGRPLSSDETLILVQAFVIAAFLYARGQFPAKLLYPSLALLPVVLILQHRSVWVVAIISLAIIYRLAPSLRPMMLKLTVLGGTFASILVFGFFGDVIFKALTDSYEEAFSKNSTFVWRVLGWVSLLTGPQMDTVREILMGSPFGSGWARSFSGLSGGYVEIEDIMPHNYYVQTIMRSGALGIVCFLLLYRKLLSGGRRLLDLSNDASGFPLALYVILIGQLVYYIPYGADSLQAIFIGSAISVLRHVRLKQQLITE